MLREKITAEEFEMMTDYRLRYAAPNCINLTNPTISIYDYLFTWEHNKINLYNILGNNLIISKPFFYKKGMEESFDQFYDYDSFREVERNISALSQVIFDVYQGRKKPYSDVSKTFNDYFYFMQEHEQDERDNFSRFGTLSCGLNNILTTTTLFGGDGYSRSSFELPLMNGKKLKIAKGMKPMKIIRKIYEAFNLDMREFEQFNLDYSMILNDAKIEGVLNLSIHPFDFWTMSHNTYGWTSCMDWTDDGCYRRGTLATMNSPNVVIAYITDPHRRDLYLGNDHYWSDKKWRQLFIVDEDTGSISSIKAYPYHNEHITVEVMNWLKELWEKADSTISFNASNLEKVNGNDLSNRRFELNGDEFKMNYSCHPMYCDMNCALEHYIYFSNRTCDYLANQRHKSYSTLFVDIEYGSEVNCLWCGSDCGDFDSEGSLCCAECYTMKTPCIWCGNLVFEDDSFYDENVGGCVCEYCLAENYRVDINSYRYECKEDMVPVKLTHFDKNEDRIVYLPADGFEEEFKYFKEKYFPDDVIVEHIDGIYTIDYRTRVTIGSYKYGISRWDTYDCSTNEENFFDFLKKI